MNTVVDACLPARDFALGETFERHGAAQFEICRAVANTHDATMPFVWGSGVDDRELQEALRADPSTRSVELVSQFDDEQLFRVGWSAKAQLLFDLLLDDDGAALLDGGARDGEWQLRLVFPEERCVEAVYADCEELDVDLSVERAYTLSDAHARDQFQLTQKQYETILAAYEMGYYDIPRETNQRELAEELDVSHQALSERLRRGHEALIANGLGVELEGEPEEIGGGIDAGTDRLTLAGADGSGTLLGE